jgi:hypothetical protein
MPPSGRVARDFTDIMGHRNKQWTANDLSLVSVPGGGIDWVGGAVGIASAGASLLIATPALLIVGFSLYWLVVVFAVFLIAGYAVGQWDSGGREGPKEKLATAATALLRQPIDIVGGKADQHPYYLHWRVIMWRPDWATVYVNEPMRRFAIYDPTVVAGDEFPSSVKQSMGFSGYFQNLIRQADDL